FLHLLLTLSASQRELLQGNARNATRSPMNPTPPSASPGPPPPGQRAAPTDSPPAAAGLSVPSFCAVSLPELQAASQARAGWLWQGYLAHGNVTLLTSQWKAGKTTLLSVLLACLNTGGLVAGLPVRPGKAVVVSEESPAHWAGRSQKLDFGDHVLWLCRPFRGKPRREERLALVDYLTALSLQRGLDLVVIDPLAAFLPGLSENNAASLLDMLLPLQRLTA